MQFCRSFLRDVGVNYDLCDTIDQPQPKPKDDYQTPFHQRCHVTRSPELLAADVYQISTSPAVLTVEDKYPSILWRIQKDTQETEEDTQETEDGAIIKYRYILNNIITKNLFIGRLVSSP